jgi:CheY-like chemotaxis protein
MPQIAIIDDDPDLIRFLTEALAPNHEVTSYASGRAAVEGLLSVLPDLVLLDIDLGDMSGVEVAHAIREHPKIGAVPIVAITAHDQEGERKRIITEGFTAFLAKPITDVAALLALVGSLAGTSAAPLVHRDRDRETVCFERLERGVRLALDALDAAEPERAKEMLRVALTDAGCRRRSIEPRLPQ